MVLRSWATAPDLDAVAFAGALLVSVEQQLLEDRHNRFIAGKLRAVVGERGTVGPPIPSGTNIDCVSSSAYASHSKVFAVSGGASRSLLGRCSDVSR